MGQKRSGFTYETLRTCVGKIIQRIRISKFVDSVSAGGLIVNCEPMRVLCFRKANV